MCKTVNIRFNFTQEICQNLTFLSCIVQDCSKIYGWGVFKKTMVENNMGAAVFETTKIFPIFHKIPHFKIVYKNLTCPFKVRYVQNSTVFSIAYNWSWNSSRHLNQNLKSFVYNICSYIQSMIWSKRHETEVGNWIQPFYSHLIMLRPISTQLDAWSTLMMIMIMIVMIIMVMMVLMLMVFMVLESRIFSSEGCFREQRWVNLDKNLV